MKAKKNKLLALLLSLVMVTAMLPMTAFAADTHKVAIHSSESGMGIANVNGVVHDTYYLVNSEGILDKDNADQNNYNIYYDENSAQLTINNLHIESNKPLLVPGGTTINVIGTNEMKEAGIGVVSNGDITIAGSGSLYISSSVKSGIYRAPQDNSSWPSTQGGVMINGDVKLTIDHMGAASCISADKGDVVIGGSANVKLNPREGIDKDNASIVYFDGGNIIIRENAQVSSSGSLDTTGTNTAGEYGKITVDGRSTLTITDECDRGVSLRGYGGVEVAKDAKLIVSSNTKSGQAIVASKGSVSIAGEAEVQMTNATPAGNAALYAQDIAVTGKLTVNGGTNGLYLNGGNTVIFNGANVNVSNCMIGIAAKVQIINSSVEMNTTVRAFNSTTSAELTDDYAIFVGASFDKAIFVPHENGVVQAGTWEKAYVRIEPHVCTYDQQIVSVQYKAMDATCTKSATYYYSCVCGAKGTITFADGVPNPANHTGGEATCTSKAVCERCGSEYGNIDPNNHKAESTWTWENDKHYHKCEYGCGTHLDEAACSGGEDTCTSKPVCTTCNSEYGEKDPVKHTGQKVWVQTKTTHKEVYNCCNVEISPEENHQWESGTCTKCLYPCVHTGGEATCTSKAICEHCGSEYGNIAPDNHKAERAWTWENDKHYHKCEYGCGTHLDEAACSGGEDTCTSKPVCTTCNSEYGEKDPVKHTGQKVWVQTETTHKEVYNCCNAEVSQEQNHQWGDGKCKVCQYPCTHTGGEATCTSKAVCELCGSEYGNIDPNNHKAESTWTWESDKHYHKCEYGCGTHLDEADCSGGEADCTNKAECTVCKNGYGSTDDSNHANLVKTEAKAPTCTADGKEAYYTCSCGKYFSDEKGKNEIKDLENYGIIKAAGHTASDWIIDREATADSDGMKYKECTVCQHVLETETIPATGIGHIHRLSPVSEKSPTCTHKGNSAYYTCDCGKWFADAAGADEITDKSSVVKEADPNAHDWNDWVVTKEATAEEEGTRTRTCKHDSAHTETDIIAKLPYIILEGADQEYVSGKGLVVRANGAFSKFVELKVDGVTVNKNNYTVKSGSTIVTLKSEYLDTLTVGAHTLTFVYTDGEVSTRFTIPAKENTKPTNPTDSTKPNDINKPADDSLKSPKTGDNSNMILWIAVLFVSGFGILGTFLYNEKKKEKAE